MAYREKIAWLSLLAMAATFGPYFAVALSAAHQNDSTTNLRLLVLYGIAAAVQLLIQGIGRLWLRKAAGSEARLAPDERDRTIEHHSIKSAYFFLIAGMILVGCVMPFNSSGWTVVNAALAMIVTAELVHYGMVVFSMESCPISASGAPPVAWGAWECGLNRG